MQRSLDGLEHVHFALDIMELPVVHLQGHACPVRYAQGCMIVHSKIHALVVLCTSTSIERCVAQLAVRNMPDSTIHAHTRTHAPGFRR